MRSAGTRHTLTVDGVVDLPSADSFFQVVGLAPGAGATAPPDNIVLVPEADFAATVGTTTVVRQLHVGFRHSALPSDPQTAAILVGNRKNHLQAVVAGGALIGDNLGTALTAAGEDARYADLLFLLLGLPGLALAAVVAGLVVALALGPPPPRGRPAAPARGDSILRPDPRGRRRVGRHRVSGARSACRSRSSPFGSRFPRDTALAPGWTRSPRVAGARPAPRRRPCCGCRSGRDHEAGVAAEAARVHRPDHRGRCGPASTSCSSPAQPSRSR